MPEPKITGAIAIAIGLGTTFGMCQPTKKSLNPMVHGKVEYIHHTSIIAEINGNHLVLIHQNFGNDPAIKKTVQKSDLNLGSLRSGKLWIYRPTQ